MLRIEQKTNEKNLNNISNLIQNWKQSFVNFNSIYFENIDSLKLIFFKKIQNVAKSGLISFYFPLQHQYNEQLRHQKRHREKTHVI